MTKRIRVGAFGGDVIDSLSFVTFRDIPVGKAFITYNDKEEAVIYRKEIEPSWAIVIYSEDKVHEMNKYQHFGLDEIVIGV